MISRLRSPEIPIILNRNTGRFERQKLHILRISILKSHFDDFSVFLQNTQILIDSKATKCRNNVDFGSKKLDFWNSQEYRFFELEIHHYSFLLEFVEFLDEMKTPEIKKSMKLGHHSVHLSKSWISRNTRSALFRAFR